MKKPRSELAAIDFKNEIEKSGGLIAVVFGYIRSPKYTMAVHLAKAAASYQEIGNGTDKKKVFHASLYARTREQAGHALALLRVAGNWRSSRVHTNSTIDSHAYFVIPVLECYFQSMAIGDHRGHCYWTHQQRRGDCESGLGSFDLTEIIISSLNNRLRTKTSPRVESSTYTIPCSRLRNAAEYTIDGHSEKDPVPLVEKVHALAVKSNCAWCPHFDIRAFKKI